MPGDLLIRTVREDELRRFFDVAELAFGEEMHEGDYERHVHHVAPDRAHAAFDCDDLVGTAAAYSLTLTVPGGEVPAAGVTMVGVLPTHRRRGLLTRLMGEQLADIHHRGEPVAILWASEAPIYGRFGYGLASRVARMDADTSVTFRVPADPRARIRLVPREEALDVVAPIYERVRVQTPGMFARTTDWWNDHRLSDPPHYRQRGGPLAVAVLELDGQPAGYARYRLESKWKDGVPQSAISVGEVTAETPQARLELWRFLFNIDLTTRVKGAVALDDALFHAVLDPRRLRWTVVDSLFLRIVDVEAAFAARTFASADPVVVELADEACPWNAGRWELGDGGARRTDAEPELALGAEELGAVYLGGTTVGELADALRVRELRPGAAERADSLLRTERAPFCPEVF